MAKDVIPKLQRFTDYRLPAILLIYSIGILLSPHFVLCVGGIILWILLLYRWLWGGCIA